MKFLIAFILLVKLLNGLELNEIYMDDEDLWDNNSDDFYSDNDDDVDEYLLSIYKIIAQIQDTNEGSPLGVALQATNADCIKMEYEKYDLLELLSKVSESIRESNFDDVVLFTSVATMCSRKVDVVLKLKFDLLVDKNGPMTIITSDPTFKLFTDNLECFYNYAVNQSLIDPNVHNIKYAVIEEISEDCMKIVKTFQTEFYIDPDKHLNSDRTKCLHEGFSFDKSTLRYLLLNQLSLPEDELDIELKQYIDDARLDHALLLSCMKDKRQVFSWTLDNTQASEIISLPF